VQRACLEAGAAALRSTSPMVGAQLVWRCYDDALPEPGDVYSLSLGDQQHLEIVSGMPAAPAAGVSRRRGRGVHPDSLLAWGALPPQLELLFRSAADLCTAGDLLVCEDLFTV